MTTQRRSREDETYAETFLDLKTTQTTFHQRPKNHSIATTTVTVTEIEESAEDTPTQSQTRALPALPSHIDLKATHLKSSPYDDPLNFLILTELATQERLFAIALTSLQSTRPNYATAPYLDSFNWSAVFALLRDLCTLSGVNWQQQEFYLVIFRSKLRSDADRNRLGQLDQKSHQEACESGGLLTYWFGTPDAEMRNLATCELHLTFSWCVSRWADDVCRYLEESRGCSRWRKRPMA